MPLSRGFVKSLKKVPVPSHKALARRLAQYAVRERIKLGYAGTTGGAPTFVIFEGHFKLALAKEFHPNLPKIMSEMSVYMLEAGYLSSSGFAFHLSKAGIDLSEETWWERHPIWLGAIIGGLVSFVGGLFQAAFNHYFGW